MAESKLFIDAAGRAAEAKAFPLTWAQANMWESASAHGGASGLARRLNLSRHTAQPGPSLTIEHAVAGLSQFVSAYDIARTTFDLTQRTQLIQPEVTIPIQVISSGTDTAADYREFLTEMASSLFSLSSEPPIRFGLVVEGEVVRSVIAVLSHFAFDGASWGPLARLMERGLNGIVGETLQPADLVMYENSDRMQEQSDESLRRWANRLSTLPPGCGLRPTSQGAFTEWGLRSREMAIAVQTIATHTAVSTTSVLLAALTTILKSTLADPPSVMLSVCSNRHHPDLAKYAGIALENALYVIPPLRLGDDFDRYVVSAQMSAIRGYAKARYDSTRWRAMLTEMNARGMAPDLSYFFNDARLDTKAWDGLEDRVEELRPRKHSNQGAAATAVGSRDLCDATLFLNLRDAGPTAQIVMTCDDVLIRPAQAIAILHHLEEFLVSRALGLR